MELLKHELKDILYLLGDPGTAPDKYRQICSLVAADPSLSALFAQPLFFGRQLGWRSSLPGTAVCYKDLSNEDKGFAKIEMRKEINKLQDHIMKYHDKALVDLINNCLEIPDLNSVYVIYGDRGRKNVVLTKWGFMDDTPGAQKGVIKDWIVATKIILKFNLYYYKDGKKIPGRKAANTEIVVDAPNFSNTVKSDANGEIMLEGIKEGAIIKMFELSDVAKDNPQIFKCWENGVYDVYVNAKADMVFHVEDVNGRSLSRIEFQFEFGGKTSNCISNEDGVIILPNIQDGTRVDAYQFSGSTNARNNFSTFLFNSKDEFYTLVVY